MIKYLKYYADLLYYFYKCSIQCLINSANQHLLLMRSRLGTFFYMNELVFISYIDNFTEIVSGILKILWSPMYIYIKLLCTLYIYNFYCQLHLNKLGKICHSIGKYYLSQWTIIILYHDKKHRNIWILFKLWLHIWSIWFFKYYTAFIKECLQCFIISNNEEFYVVWDQSLNMLETIFYQSKV